MTPMPNSALKICIVAHAAYGALTGGDTGHAGGVERQTSMLAHWLAARGHDVSFITWDEGEPEASALGRVRLLRLCGEQDGIPGLRFFHPRWTSLNRALSQADAEVYYQNGAEYVTGQVASWCRRHGRSFVFSAAGDRDCDPTLPELTKTRERILYRYGLRHADEIIVQTRRQQGMIQQLAGRPAKVQAMPCPAPEDSGARIEPGAAGTILWVGRISPVKRFELLVDVAAATPEYTFEVAGAPDGADESTLRALARAAALPNVVLHGQVPRPAMGTLYRRAALLCCTSAVEGFPNVFLEAWSHGIPVVTTFDPDDLVRHQELGAAVSNVPEMAAALRKLMSDSPAWKLCSENARRYFAENHDFDRVMTGFEEILASSAQTRSRTLEEPVAVSRRGSI